MGVNKLRDGDYCLNGKGGFETVSGVDAVLERVMFQLTVRRGSFPLLPTLGSRLYLLPKAKPSARSVLGAGYAAEALAGEKEVSVKDAVWDEQRQRLTIQIAFKGETLSAVMTL